MTIEKGFNNMQMRLLARSPLLKDKKQKKVKALRKKDKPTHQNYKIIGPKVKKIQIRKEFLKTGSNEDNMRFEHTMNCCITLFMNAKKNCYNNFYHKNV